MSTNLFDEEITEQDQAWLDQVESSGLDPSDPYDIMAELLNGAVDKTIADLTAMVQTAITPPAPTPPSRPPAAPLAAWPAGVPRIGPLTLKLVAQRLGWREDEHIQLCEQSPLRPKGGLRARIIPVHTLLYSSIGAQPLGVQTDVGFIAKRFYFGINPVDPDYLAKRPPVKNRHTGEMVVDTTARPNSREVTRIADIFADLDRKPDGCRDADTLEAVMAALVEALGTDPSLIVETGHGRHPHWAVHRGDIGSGHRLATLADAIVLLHRVDTLFARIAHDVRGAKLDPMKDPPRIARCPGSVNGGALVGGSIADQRPAYVVDAVPGEGIDIDDLLALLDAEGIPEDPVVRRRAEGKANRAAGVVAPPDARPVRHGAPTAGRWAAGCGWVHGMFAGWLTDGAIDPKQSSRWVTLQSRVPRWWAALLVGCITEEEFTQGQALLNTVHANAYAGDEGRDIAGETEELWEFGYRTAAEKPTVALWADELGNHMHERDADAELWDTIPGPDPAPRTAEPDTVAGVTVSSAPVDTAPAPAGPSAAAPGSMVVGRSGGPNRLPERLVDSYLVDWLTTFGGLDVAYRWCSGLGWLHYDGRRWREVPDPMVITAVKTIMQAVIVREVRSLVAKTADGVKPPKGRVPALVKLLSKKQLTDLTALARGQLGIDAALLDARPELLNVGNGTVDLRTGQLRPHDPDDLLTKITDVDYRPGAQHPDWAAALTALPADVAEYLRVRVGQAATGHPPDDDVVCFLKGGGENGKSTVLTSVRTALGEHAVYVSEKVLIQIGHEHSTEVMDFRGARLALHEELPEGRHLNMKRIKDSTSPLMKARRMRQDPVEFHTTHGLFVSTNPTPLVVETDHGTWRRLMMIVFPYTYLKPGQPVTDPEVERTGDPGLRSRLKAGAGGRAEAVLAWIVSGARDWYRRGEQMPPPPAAVVADTRAWRAGTDRVGAFIEANLVGEAGWHVAVTDVQAVFNRDGDGQDWSANLLVDRFTAHPLLPKGVDRRQIRPGPAAGRPSRPPGSGFYPGGLPARYWAWVGMRFRTAADDLAAMPTQSSDQAG